MLALSLLLLALAPLSLARVSRRSTCAPKHHGGCDVSKAQLVLPPNQTLVTQPTGQALRFVTLGVGTQNFTCDPTAGNYTAAGSVAKLFDISCAYGSEAFAKLSTVYYDMTNSQGLAAAQDAVARAGYPLIGNHYFGQFGNTTNPVYDFRGDGILKADPLGYDVVIKTGIVPDPTNPTVDGPTLQLAVDAAKNTGGTAITSAYRVVTKGGQAPATCTGTDSLAVNFAAQFWFYK